MAKANILVVDDETAYSDVLFELLSDRGHNVIVVENAADALALCEDADFDWIISDVDMPGDMDGIDLISKVRTRKPHQKVMMMTGNFAKNEARLKPLKTMVYQKPLESLAIMAKVIEDQ